MTMEPALLEKKGHIALITLNRPEARNSFSPEMLVRLAGHWEEVRDDANIRVAIVTGAGCVGPGRGNGRAIAWRPAEAERGRLGQAA